MSGSDLAIGGQNSQTIQSNQKLQEHREAQAKKTSEQPKIEPSGGKEADGGSSVQISRKTGSIGINVDTLV